ncbi:MAG: M23 family metallopeptidase [Sphingomonas sp.]
MDQREQGFGHGGGALALGAPAFGGTGFGRAVPPRERPRGRMERLRDSLRDLDLVVDLGARIGSPTWWRGLATCTALCGGMMALWPAMPALDAPSGTPLSPAQAGEMRAIGVAPIGLGADTGRRMAATAAVEPLTDTPERPRLDLTATLGLGDGFTRVLERAGVGASEAQAVAAAVARVQPLDGIAPGTRIALTLGRRPNRTVARPIERIALRARFDLALDVVAAGGAFRLEPHPIAVNATPLRIQGQAGTSLYRAARAAGVPAGVVADYLKAIASRVSVGGIGAADRFDLVVEHRRAATGEAETGRLLYAGLIRPGQATRLMRWTTGGRETWFEASGMGERRGVMMRPVIGRQTSGFGLRRHPVLGFTRFHKGTDFAAPHGAPIVAAADGRVAFAGWHGGHGNYVLLDNGGAIRTGYGHMSRIIVAPGTFVQQGTVIGYVGSTGLSTGPHLHYEVFRGGVAVNPATFAFTTGSALGGADLARFRATLARLMALSPGSGTRTAQAGGALPPG